MRLLTVLLPANSDQSAHEIALTLPDGLSIEEDRLQTALTTAKVEGLQLEAQRVLDKTGTASLRVWPLAKDLGRVGEGPIIMANPLDKCVNLRLTRLLEANSECYTKKAKKKVELPTFGGDVLIAWKSGYDEFTKSVALSNFSLKSYYRSSGEQLTDFEIVDVTHPPNVIAPQLALPKKEPASRTASFEAETCGVVVQQFFQQLMRSLPIVQTALDTLVGVATAPAGDPKGQSQSEVRLLKTLLEETLVLNAKLANELQHFKFLSARLSEEVAKLRSDKKFLSEITRIGSVGAAVFDQRQDKAPDVPDKLQQMLKTKKAPEDISHTVTNLLDGLIRSRDERHDETAVPPQKTHPAVRRHRSLQKVESDLDEPAPKLYRVSQHFSQEPSPGEQFARLSVGAFVTVEREDPSGWWWVTSVQNPNESGWFPLSFLEEVPAAMLPQQNGVHLGLGNLGVRFGH
ncbi:MAG: uncharacterized protein KVP18_004799 [Porospora cf. gigantea A]|uniref:uncharacterized protein n=1 Tax=Porospora cf. gigantea A TaxID=2853593 RepID=UPI0035593E7D|nr:MAG: hypothetical protein KVP18_004799 [Porospora cf. gigantea A]